MTSNNSHKKESDAQSQEGRDSDNGNTRENREAGESTGNASVITPNITALDADEKGATIAILPPPEPERPTVKSNPKKSVAVGIRVKKLPPPAKVIAADNSIQKAAAKSHHEKGELAGVVTVAAAITSKDVDKEESLLSERTQISSLRRSQSDTVGGGNGTAGPAPPPPPDLYRHQTAAPTATTTVPGAYAIMQPTGSFTDTEAGDGPVTLAAPSSDEHEVATDEDDSELDRSAQDDCPWDITGSLAVRHQRDEESPSNANDNDQDVDLEAGQGYQYLVQANPVLTRDSFSARQLPAAEMIGSAELQIMEQKRQQHKDDAAKQQRRIMSCAVYGVACVILVIVLVVVLTSKDKDANALAAAPTMPPSSEAPSSAPTGSLDLLLSNLPDDTLHSLQNYSTPQWKAMDWVTRHPDLNMMEEWRKVQLFALATFFYAFEGPHWREEIRNNWMLHDVSECLWFSSAFGRFYEEGHSYEEKIQVNIDPCNEHGRIQAIILNDLQLAGREALFPPEIALLTSLSYMSLHRNGITATLTKAIPLEMYQLANITHLGLNNNQLLTGIIPTELATMTRLRDLRLDDCSLSGTLPTQLALLQDLQYLMLQRNKKIQSTIPTEYGTMTSLLRMRLNQNKITGTVPTELGMLTLLRELQLAKAKLTGTIPVELSALTNLGDFRAQKNKFTGTLPSEYGLLTSLSRLNLGYNNLQEGTTIPTEFGRLTNLHQFYLTQSSLSGPIPSECGLWTNLRTFAVGGNHLSYLPTELWQLSLLHVLQIDGNEFDRPFPTEIGLLTSLVELLADDSLFTGTVPSELGLLTHLKMLQLHDNQLSGSIPSELPLLASSGSLEYLTLGGNSLSGVVPDALCALGWFNASIETKNPKGLEFDCGGLLCGCDWCPCGNS